MWCGKKPVVEVERVVGQPAQTWELLVVQLRLTASARLAAGRGHTLITVLARQVVLVARGLHQCELREQARGHQEYFLRVLQTWLRLAAMAVVKAVVAVVTVVLLERLG